MHVLETDGLFQTQEEVDSYPTITDRVGPGDIKYVDRNNDGVIDGEDRYIAGNIFLHILMDLILVSNIKNYHFPLFGRELKILL